MPQGEDLFAGLTPVKTQIPSVGDDLFADLHPTAVADPEFETAVGRQSANLQNLQENIDRLRKIKPANAAHKARIDKLIASYERQLPQHGGFVAGDQPGVTKAQAALGGIFGGATKGLISSTAGLLGAAIAPAGKGPFKGLGEAAAEARAQIEEDVPTPGVTGSVANTIGEIAGGLPVYGGAANLTTQGIVRALPKSAIARAAEAVAPKIGQRIAVNVVGGLPLNIVQAVGQPVSGDAEHDLAARVKQFGIGTVADVLFGMIPQHGKKAAPASKIEAEAPKAEIAPERTQAFLDTQAKRQAREAAAAYDKNAKTQARAEWQVKNAGKKWTDLIPDDRKTLVSQWKERNPKTDTSKAVVTDEQQAALDAGAQPVANPVEVASTNQAVQQAIENKGLTETYSAKDLMKALHAADEAVESGLTFDQFIEKHPDMKTFVDPTWYEQRSTKRVEAERAVNVDELTGTGNKRAYSKALQTAEEDPNTAIVRFDLNGFKAVNDLHGHQEGDRVLSSVAKKINSVAIDLGLPVRTFRVGGDEFAAIIPADKAEAFRKEVETRVGVEDLGKAKYSISGGSGQSDALADAAAMANKLEQKRAQGIPDRDTRIGVAEAPTGVKPAGAGETPAVPELPSGAIEGDDFDQIVSQVQAKGGLKDPAELAAFNEELLALHEKDLTPSEFEAEVQGLVEDFTPLTAIEEGASGGDVSRAVTEASAIERNRESQASAESTRGEPDAAGSEASPDSKAFWIEEHGELKYQALMKRWNKLSDAEKAKAWDYGAHDEIDLPNAKNLPGQVATALSYLESGIPKRSMQNLPRPHELSPEQAAVAGGAEALQRGQLKLESPSATPKPSTREVLPEERSTLPRKGQNATDSSVSKTGTHLETLEHKQALEELSPKKIETMTDRLLHQLESVEKGSPESEAMHRDLETLMGFEKAAESPSPLVSQAEAPLPEGAVVRPEAPASVTGADFVTRTADAPIESLDPKIARKLFQSPLKKLSPEDLNAHIDDMQSRVSVLGKDEGRPYRERLDKALEERAERFQSQAGVRLQIPPAAGGFTAGFIGGFLSSDDDTDRLTNALAWGAVGAAAGYGAGRYLQRGTAAKIRSGAELPGGAWQEEIHKHVITDYERGQQPVGLREKLRGIYQGVIRRTLVAERFMQSLGAARLGAERNAAKLLGMYGRWTGQTESALKYGPALFDEFGNYKKLDALGIDDILAMVDGDVETLGDLMAARTKVEMGDLIKTPFDTVAAEKMFFSVPEQFHKAADEMRKFSLAMAEVLVDAGILSRDGLDKFKLETMYATLQRVFKMDSKFSTSAEAKASSVVKAANPLKARKGGADAPIKNSVESTIASVPWYYRAAEQNKIKHGLVEAWEAAGSPSAIMRRVTKSEVKVSPEHEAKIAQLKAEIKGLSDENAHALVAGLDPTAIDPLEGTMRVYRDGVVESYKMPKELALALQTMNSEDVGTLVKLFGAPARLATKGVVYNPFFLAKMGFFDTWQATMNSQYGFRPGIDNIRGWLNIVLQSKKYQELLGVGFSHQSFAASKESFSTKMESVKTNKGSPLEVAIRQVAQMKPIEAYKTLVAPIGDAARIGEALRALDHGASTIEAVYAAKQVTANYGEVGQFAQMRALNHIIMFLNPALQVMDQTFYRMGVHPFRVSEEGRLSDIVRYTTKAFAGLTVPSMLLWAKYHDDEEITQMRQTRTGSRYWWMRSPVAIPGVVDKDQIIKIPKPLFDGQIWGTSAETALDNYKGTDPVAASALAKSLLRDAAFNILPTVGQIPYSLQANQDLSWGGHIIPLADDQLALEHQGEDRASWISREISKKIAPLAQGSESAMLRNSVTPAGLDYIIRSVGGMLGQDAVLAISQAMEAQEKGYVPAKEELPMIRNVVVDYPNTRTRDIEQFYDRLRSVQTVGATINHLAREDPEKLADYMENNQADYMLVKAFGQTRQTIANFRRAIVDIRRMDGDEISSTDKREIAKTYVELINQAAATAMLQAKEIDSALKPAESHKQKRSTPEWTSFGPRWNQDSTKSVINSPYADSVMSITGRPKGGIDAMTPDENLDWVGKWTSADKILMNPGKYSSRNMVENTLAHELQHSRTAHDDGGFIGRFFKSAGYDKPKAGTYAATDSHEQVAEAFMTALSFLRSMDKSIRQGQKPSGAEVRTAIDHMNDDLPGAWFMIQEIIKSPKYRDTPIANFIRGGVTMPPVVVSR